MQYMVILTWEPEKRDEVIERAQTLGIEPPEGMKVIGRWADLDGGRTFEVVETDDPKAMVAAGGAWSDLCKIESTPVMELEEAMKLIPSK